MEKNKLIWCLRIKTGIKITLPSEEEYNSYISTAREDLSTLTRGSIPQRWAPVVAYYCAYYSLYAVLRLIGIKSENHSCSIEIFKYVLNSIGEKEGKVKIIEELKKKREDAQYYLKEVEINVQELQNFVEYISSIKNKILLKRESLRKHIKEVMEVANKEEF